MLPMASTHGLYYPPTAADQGDKTVKETVVMVEPDPAQYAGSPEFHKIHTVLVDGGDRFGVSSIAFDLHEELLWMGNQGGHVTSYYGSNVEKYTSFQVASQEIRHILPLGEVVLFLSPSQLKGHLRRGPSAFAHTSEFLQEMQCMLPSAVRSSSVLMGGHQPDLIEYDLQHQSEAQRVDIGQAGCAILRNQGRYVCAGQADGRVKLLDLRTYNTEHEIEAHTGSLSDFDIHGNLMVTCGFSSRIGSLSVDRFLKVYDIRILRAMAPIPVTIDPFLLRFITSFSSRICTISPGGQMEILETQAVSSSNYMLYQVASTGSVCSSFDVSSTGVHMAFGDSAGTLNIFSSNPISMYNSYSRSTEFADPVETFPEMTVTDEKCVYSSIPLPATNSKLSSEWPQELLKRTYWPPPEIDLQILQTMKMIGNVGYAPNPGNLPRNYVRYRINSPSFEPKSSIDGVGSQNLGDLKNQVSHGTGLNVPNSNITDIQLSPTASLGQKLHNRNFAKSQIPKRFSRWEWKKGNFEDSNPDSYNKTKFAGLEAATVNSYCNAMVQALYHLDYLRSRLLGHLCKKEGCLSCELGFLFHMMDRSKSFPCLASNFLRAFRAAPEASALGLILHENLSKKRSIFFRLIQAWNRFILHQIETETGKDSLTKTKSPESSIDNKQDPISKLFSIVQVSVNRCTRCGKEENKEAVINLSNLQYTPDNGQSDKTCQLTEVLKKSLRPEQITPAWCEKCEKYQPTYQSRVPTKLPAVLCLNTGLDNTHDFQAWKKYLELLLTDRSKLPSNLKSCRYGKNCIRQDCKFWHGYDLKDDEETVKTTEFDKNMETVVKWIPERIRIKISQNDSVCVTDIASDEENKAEDEECGAVDSADYELKSVICFIKDPESEERSNLVSIIRIEKPYFERSGQPESGSGVREVPLSDATSFNPKWKIPAVIHYKKVTLPEDIANPVMEKIVISSDVFSDNVQSKESKRKKKLNFTPLSSQEIPKAGDIVAIDSECVTLGQEETELRSDGKLSTVKPQLLSVARVTCVRSTGSMQGVPFMDDYISTQEVVVDYMTKFSGIQPGDLDKNSSSKNVIGLKAVYMKLRYLLDSGVKFLGHGLNNDFRVLNLLVPQEQILDTVLLFHLPNERYVSLRFLAWYYLGTIIQSEVHDSGEDARTALELYRKYEDLSKKGTLEDSIIEMYATGKNLQWKIPEEEENEKSHSSSQSESLPNST